MPVTSAVANELISKSSIQDEKSTLNESINSCSGCDSDAEKILDGGFAQKSSEVGQAQLCEEVHKGMAQSISGVERSRSCEEVDETATPIASEVGEKLCDVVDEGGSSFDIHREKLCREVDEGRTQKITEVERVQFCDEVDVTKSSSDAAQVRSGDDDDGVVSGVNQSELVGVVDVLKVSERFDAERVADVEDSHGPNVDGDVATTIESCDKPALDEENCEREEQNESICDRLNESFTEDIFEKPVDPKTGADCIKAPGFQRDSSFMDLIMLSSRSGNSSTSSSSRMSTPIPENVSPAKGHRSQKVCSKVSQKSSTQDKFQSFCPIKTPSVRSQSDSPPEYETQIDVPIASSVVLPEVETQIQSECTAVRRPSSSTDNNSNEMVGVPSNDTVSSNDAYLVLTPSPTNSTFSVTTAVSPSSPLSSSYQRLASPSVSSCVTSYDRTFQTYSRADSAYQVHSGSNQRPVPYPDSMNSINNLTRLTRSLEREDVMSTRMEEYNRSQAEPFKQRMNQSRGSPFIVPALTPPLETHGNVMHSLGRPPAMANSQLGILAAPPYHQNQYYNYTALRQANDISFIPRASGILPINQIGYHSAFRHHIPASIPIHRFSSFVGGRNTFYEPNSAAYAASSTNNRDVLVEQKYSQNVYSPRASSQPHNSQWNPYYSNFLHKELQTDHEILNRTSAENSQNHMHLARTNLNFAQNPSTVEPQNPSTSFSLSTPSLSYLELLKNAAGVGPSNFGVYDYDALQSTFGTMPVHH